MDQSRRFSTWVWEACGWYGVVALLGAYALTTWQIFLPTHPILLTLNATGALGIVLDAWNQKNYQPVILNLVWGVVALVALARTLTGA